MKNLLKNNFRYLFKNKIIAIAILILLSIAIMVFFAFINLVVNIKNTYNNLTQNYNLHNIVINEMYSQNEETANQQKKEFYDGLDTLNVDYREFNSININNTTNEELLKVIEYVASYSIDRLDVFSQTGLPQNPVYHNYVLPNAIDFNAIIAVASANLNADETKSENILARQKLVYFMNKADFKVNSFKNEFSEVWQTIYNDPNYDPLNPNTTTATTAQKNVAKYLNAFLNPNNTKYSPIIVRGCRITINLTEFNSGIPATGYFEDPYAYLAIVSNDYMQANNKAYYSFDEYQKNILNNSSDSQGFKDKLELLPSEVTQFPNIKSTLDINNWLNSVDDKYKIYVDSIPYLIVGSGITPDFIYPILSFANTIPNPKKEAIIYTNSNGYKRTETSFESAPHENFLAAKYNGPLARTQILNEINQLTRKSMSWPSNVTAAYWYDDINNKMSPTALRIEFINTVIKTFVTTVIILTSFVLILVLFVMVLFVKRFINQNKANIAISISNGINKFKILFSISISTTFICLFAGPIGLLLGGLLEQRIFLFLQNYWFLPTPIGNYSGWWFVFAALIPTLVFLLLIFGVGIYFLKDNLISLLKQNGDLKINKSYLGFRKIIAKANVMYKLRSSLIFSSLTKIIFITVLSTLSIATLTFASSATSQLGLAYDLETNTNKSTYAIDLFTPTSQGGQYFGVPIQYVGHALWNQDETENLTDVGYSTGLYGSIYRNSPIFKNYSSMFWASANDSSAQKNDILYIKNKVGNQLILNYFFGVGSLGTNPWNISKSLLPINQMNSSNSLSIQLVQKMLMDLRPYNQAFFSSISNLQPLVANDTTNANPFPSEWVIQNFNLLNQPQDWKLVYQDKNGYDGNIGIINASEIYDENNTSNLRWITPQDVLKDESNLATIINDAYNTYGASYKNENITSSLTERLYPKYYGNLFSQDAISDIRVEDNAVRFKVDVNKNEVKSLITTRSYLMKQFMQQIEINEENESSINNSDIILDPLDYNSFALKQYGYQLKNVVQVLKLNDNFIKLFLHTYNDPAYIPLFYRILNNYALLDDDTDEPYVYVNNTFNGETIKVLGIKSDSKFIKLYNNKNEPINNKLFLESNDVIPLIINNYAAKKFNLKINDTIQMQTNNHIQRYEYDNVDDANIAKNVLLNNDLNFKLKTSESPIYKIVDINNTGSDVQFYISMPQAQQILGLATSNDYVNKTKITSSDQDGTLNIGMNNQWNKTGGFNGIFTSSINPLMLSTAVGTYSSSGLYPGSDSWVTSNEMTNLITATLKNKARLPYLANALQLSVSELKNIETTLTTGVNAISNNDFAKKIINVLNAKYGTMAFNTIYENANSLIQQQVMFNQLSSTFDNIVIAITTLLIFLSIIIIMIIASMVINDLLRITAILTTLGYSNYKNALTFFSIFCPAWLFSVIIAGPVSLVLNKIMEWFTFSNMSLFISIPFSWIAFVVMALAFTILFAGVFWWGLRWFKKNNLLNALKW